MVYCFRIIMIISVGVQQVTILTEHAVCMYDVSIDEVLSIYRLHGGMYKAIDSSTEENEEEIHFEMNAS